MLTKNTAQSLGLTDRTDAEQSISGGARYLQDMMSKVPDTVPEGERIWFALAAYNMGYAHAGCAGADGENQRQSEQLV